MNKRKGAKYLPFDSLRGFREGIMDVDTAFTDSYEMAVEQKEAIEETINFALAYRRKVVFHLWIDEEEELVTGVIKNYDSESKVLILKNKQRINPMNIVSIDIIDEEE